MAIASTLKNPIAFTHSQTKGLAVEIWQQVFWDASHIPNTAEFSVKAGAHNRLVWEDYENEDEGYLPGDACMTMKNLRRALGIRRAIILVCNAWYAMGIEILYAHMRIDRNSLDGMGFYRILTESHDLLAYTKRVTMILGPDDPSIRINALEYLRRAAWVCSNLPRLQILYAPPDFLALFPLQSLPSTLEIAIFAEREGDCDHLEIMGMPVRPLPAVWTNIRVMGIHTNDVLLCNTRDVLSITFPLLEDLRVHEEPRLGQQENNRVVCYLARTWLAPKLDSLTIIGLNWLSWGVFLRRHANILKTLCLATLGCFLLETFEEEDQEEMYWENPEFPNLRALYIDFYNILPEIIAKNVERVGVFDVGWAETDDLERSKKDNLRRLRSTFKYWEEYPKVTSCCISGWETLVEWLDGQPVVVEFGKRMKEKGIRVEFIALEGEDMGI